METARELCTESLTEPAWPLAKGRASLGGARALLALRWRQRCGFLPDVKEWEAMVGATKDMVCTIVSLLMTRSNGLEVSHGVGRV